MLTVGFDFMTTENIYKMSYKLQYKLQYKCVKFTKRGTEGPRLTRILGLGKNRVI